MLSLDSFRRLLPYLYITHRETHRLIPFKLNNCQRMIMHVLYELQDAGKPLFVIIPKSRRVGVSTFSLALLFGQGLSMPNSRGLVIAHLADSSKALFETPTEFASHFPIPLPKPTQKTIFFPHRGGKSIIKFGTAGAVEGGRGPSLSGLLFSEAAQLENPESFTSILPSVSKDPSSISIIESSPRGKEGKGAEFYDRCEIARRGGHGGYRLIFLSWLDDTGCRRSADEALDAPRNELERELMHDFKADLEQIAWMRWAYEVECKGIEARFLSEYPWCYDVAFTSSAYPAFEHDEIKTAEKMVALAPYPQKGHFTMDGESPSFINSGKGTWVVWETPQPGHEYFLGCDASRGRLSKDSEAIGDFSAITVINGTTGRWAARFADRISPDHFAEMIYCAARWYNEALVNIELTGGWGRWAQKRLRDDYFYSNVYGWKGKDDRLRPGRASVGGWETTQVSRDRMYNAFRSNLRSKKFTIFDEELLHQMRSAEMFYGRWEVEKGHDDILVSAFLANVAMDDYPPVRLSEAELEVEGETTDVRYQSDCRTVATNHWLATQQQILQAGDDPFG